MVCSSCQYLNRSDATLCTRCHTPLVPLLTARVTPAVPKETLIPTPKDRDVYSERLRQGEFALVMVETHTPVILDGMKRVTFGRRVPGEPPPTVDLTPYDGLLLGVSRQHAVIARSGKGYCIEDMESRNGTWVNEARLMPHERRHLTSGDLIRFGQLGVYIYFKEAESVECELILSDQNAPNGVALTPRYMKDVLAPYLTALADVQDIAQRVLGRDQAPVIKTIHTRQGDVVVTLADAEEAVRFAERNFADWRASHIEIVMRMGEVGELMQWMVGEVAQEQLMIEREKCRMEMQPDLLQLALKFLQEISPSELSLTYTSHLDALIAAFWTLIFSPLRIVPSLERVT
jgi:hypothetical protein